METLPVAPGGTGQPPSSPKLDSKESTPCSSAASTLARPWPRVLWKCAVSSTPPSRSRAAAKNSPTWTRVGHPGRVAEADLRTAGGGEPLGDREYPLRRHLALVGATEGGRDHPLAAQPRLARARQRQLQPGQRLLDRAVDVLAVVGLRGGDEDVDLVEALAQPQRPLQPSLVWDQDREGDARRAAAPPPAPPRRRKAAGSRRAARRRSPPSASTRSPRACRSAAPSPRSRSSPARSGTRREARPRGSSPCSGVPSRPKLRWRSRLKRLTTATSGKAHVACLESNLCVGEAKRRETRGEMGLIAQAIPRLLARGAVVAQTIGLDDEPQIRPEEINPEAVEALLGERNRQTAPRPPSAGTAAPTPSR